MVRLYKTFDSLLYIISYNIVIQLLSFLFAESFLMEDETSDHSTSDDEEAVLAFSKSKLEKELRSVSIIF